MTDEQEKVLQNLLLDIDCLKQLDGWTNNFNMFDVLKITHTEIRHSNILSWLLDPNENHKLGDSFIRAFINNIVKQGQINDLDLLMQDYYSFQVLREHNHMDIVLLSREEKTAYIIENKIWAGESKHQLKDYYNKSQEEFAEYKLIYAFLTPDGRDASDPETWISISYEEIIQMLEEIINSQSTLGEVKMLVNNYINAVRKDIMREKDEILVKICNEIYNKHREAFKLIYENVTLDKSIDSEIVCDTLREYANDGKIIYNDDNSWRFFTTRMNNYLPELQNDNSSWNTKWVYYYWLERWDSMIIIHLEIGGWNIPNDMELKMNSLIDVSKKLGNKVNPVSPFKYKRLYRKNLNINEEDYEASLKKQVKKLIDSALENEEKIFEMINEQNK